MNLQPFTGPGSTRTRRELWDKVLASVISARKTEGKNASVTEYEGQGTLVAFRRDRGGEGECLFIQSATTDCELCFIGFLYEVGDILTPATVLDAVICPPAEDPPFQIQVTEVDEDGGVTGFTIIPGIGYASIDSPFLFAFNGGAGSAFLAECTFA